MKSFVTFLFALFIALAAGPLLPEASAQAERFQKLETAEYRALLDDIEIMRRLLDKSLAGYVDDGRGYNVFENLVDKDGDESDDEETKTFRRARTLYRGTLAGSYSYHYNDSRGFYVPGSGAVFSLEVKVPVRETTEFSVKKKDRSQDDLWEETEREYRQGSSGFTTLKSEEKKKNWILDKEAMEEIIEVLVKKVARHGGNIDHLGADARITLLVKFKGDKPLDKLARATGDTALALSTYWFAYTDGPLHEDVIIQIPFSIVSRLGERFDFDEVKDAVKITRYPAKAGTKGKKKSF